MKKMVTTILMILTTMILSAPENIRIEIPAGELIGIYNVSDPFLLRVMKFESAFKADAVNPYTGARGILQILPVMINEVNKFSDVQYTWEDAWSPYKSIEIWWKVMKVKNPEYYPDLACRLWFGAGVQKHDGNDWTWYYTQVMK